MIVFVVCASVYGAPPRSGYISRNDLLEYQTQFTWDKAASSVVRITLMNDGKETYSGTGFFISEDGYFVTSFDLMRRCFESTKDRAEKSVDIRCERENLRYVAEYKNREYGVSVISHPSEAQANPWFGKAATDRIDPFDSCNFVVGKIRLREGEKVSFLTIAAPAQGRSEATGLLPMPLARIFLPGFTNDGNYRLATGEVNFLDGAQRGFVIADEAATRVMFPPPQDEEERKMREDVLRRVFPNGMGEGIRVDRSTIGSPALDAAGVVRGMLVSVALELKVGHFLTRNALLTHLFTTTEPTRAPLFHIVVSGGTKYYLE